MAVMLVWIQSLKNLIQQKMTAGTQNELQKDLSLHYRKTQSLVVGHCVGVHKASAFVFFKDSNLHILSSTLRSADSENWSTIK